LTATTRLGYFYSSPLCTWTMSKNLFAKAVEDATLEITTSYDGSRNFGGKVIFLTGNDVYKSDLTISGFGFLNKRSGYKSICRDPYSQLSSRPRRLQSPIKNSCTNVSFLVEDSERPRRGRSYRGGRGRGRGNSYYREKSSHPHPRSHIVDDDDDIDMDNVGRGGHRSDSRL
ncbi:unnamed protein product, partial [Porites evermanni]